MSKRSISKIFAGLILTALLGCSQDTTSPFGEDQNIQKTDVLKSASLHPNTHILHQIERASIHEAIRIPKHPEFTDEFYQAGESVMKIDILIIVDNSGSMYEEQLNLSTKLAPLLSGVEDTDWQIGIINTEWPCFLDNSLPYTAFTPDLANKFARSIRQGTSGSGYEKAMMMAGLNITQTTYTSMDDWATQYRQTCTPKAWLREDAALAMLILADEDEDPSSEWTPQMLFDALVNLGYKPGDSAQVNGIIYRPGTYCQEGYSHGIKHAQLIGMTGGIMGDICAEDYTMALNGISANFRDMVLQDFTLRMIPLQSTIEITINDEPYYGDYAVVGDRIIFRTNIARESRIKVTYRTDEVRSITLSQYADPATLQIQLDDTEILPEAYTYDEQQKQIRFVEALPENITLNVHYKPYGQLLKEFPFPTPQKPNSIECYHNDLLINTRYIAEYGVLRLAEPILDNEKIVCLYF